MSSKMSGESVNIRRRGKSYSAGAVRHKPNKSQAFSDRPAKHYKTNFSIMGNKNNKVSETNGKKEDKGLYLSSSYVLDIIGYFNYSSIISHGLDDYFHGVIRGKLERKSSLSYDSVLTYFSWVIFFRNILLAFIEDLEIRALLGETERIRPERQLVMAATIWSIYIAIVFLVYENSTKWKAFTWLLPFQVLRGQSSTKTYGLNTGMAEQWHQYSLQLWRKYLVVALIRSSLGIGFIIWVCSERWTYSSRLFNIMQVFWSSLNVVWFFFGSQAMYITYIYFNSLSFYFRLRYAKVNEDIESIISVTTNRMKSTERTATLHHILVEHNELCLKIVEYNRFWAKWLMNTYFFSVALICFTLFQALFTTNPVLVRILMFCIASESAYFLTSLSTNAALLSNTAHAPYQRLIRVTFDKYPVELQIQLRMFIQRLSGPTIGFYCLDLFEITYTTYASIVAALGQNFLLIVDFVRSYAEVGKEEDEVQMAFSQFKESLYNTTLSAIGYPITESIEPFIYRNSNL